MKSSSAFNSSSTSLSSFVDMSFTSVGMTIGGRRKRAPSLTFRPLTSGLCLSVRGQHLHVVRALEGRRVGDVRTAHAADHLPDRHVLVALHPLLQLGEDDRYALDPVLQKLRGHHRRV